MPYLTNLIEFHNCFQHHTEDVPTAKIPEKVRNLRSRLMREELQELEKAMVEEDLVGIADGLADLLYVVFGTALSYGIPIDQVFHMVHRANMNKLGPDGKPITDSGGKTIKPKGWEGPEKYIEEYLKACGAKI